MLGLFKKQNYQPTVTSVDKDWIEKNLIWFIEAFGCEKLKDQPFILPSTEVFSYDNLRDSNQFQKLFEQLCSYWDLNPNEIIVKFFDDFKSKQWETWVPQGEFKEPGGLYSQIYTTDKKRFKIEIAKSNLDKPQLLVAVIAHELAHVKLLGGSYVYRNDADMEPLTDLASIYFGFGVFVANTVHTTDIYWISRSGYLPSQMISYANALICFITQHDVNNYLAVLNGNTSDLFRRDFEYLKNTSDGVLLKKKFFESELVYKINKQISDGFENRKFDEVIDGSKKLLSTNPNNLTALNYIGYALLQQKKYEEAIEQFTNAITIDPYWDYPYNNRGYCKLQLGDIENAYIDLHHSFEMNPDNSFSWRNLGAYYLAIKEFDKALHYFEEAEKIDPKTELINFYLGVAHLNMGNADKSSQYMNKSLEMKEHNDSTIK